MKKLMLLSIVFSLLSCSVQKGMIECPDNQKVSRTKRHKMVKCPKGPKNQMGPNTVWLFGWRIK